MGRGERRRSLTVVGGARGEVAADGSAAELLSGGWYFATETARILRGAGGALFQVVIVVAGGEGDLRVAFEGEGVGADAVQEIAVVTHHEHDAGKRAVALGTSDIGRDRRAAVDQQKRHVALGVIVWLRNSTCVRLLRSVERPCLFE